MSVVLPVHNAEHTLEQIVEDALEVLPELSESFRLTILDDGSTDDTAEMALDLAARYPQVNVIRHPIRLGLAEAIQTGLDHSDGDYVLIGDQDYSLAPDDLRTLWQLRDMQRRATANATPSQSIDARIDRMLARRAQRVRHHGFQVIERGTFEQFRMQQATEIIRRVDKAGPQRHTSFSPSAPRGNPLMNRPNRGAWRQS